METVQVPKGFMANAKGDLVPISKIPDSVLAEDKMVAHVAELAEVVSNDLGEFLVEAEKQIEAYVTLLADKYGLSRGGNKGNAHFVTHDGRYKIQRQVSDRIVFGPELQIAKELVDQCIARWSEGSNDNIRALVVNAFDVDKEGKVNIDRILGLRRLEIKDDDWRRAMQAINDSMRTASTKTYIRVYRRLEDGTYGMIPLNISKMPAANE